MAIFIYFKNNFLLTLIILILVILFMYFLVKFGMPIKSKKKKGKIETATIEVKSKDEQPAEMKQKDAKKKQEIVAQKEEKVDKDVESVKKTQTETDYDKKERDFNEKYQFEDVSKGVSKIKFKNSAVNQKSLNEKFLKDDLILKEQENAPQEKRIRLSEAIKENDFDKIFASHLSSKYDNINPTLHLKENQELFSRTNNMLNNSMRQFDGVESNDFAEIEGERREALVQDILDEIDVGEEIGQINGENYIDVKTMIISEMILNGRKTQKK